MTTPLVLFLLFQLPDPQPSQIPTALLTAFFGAVGSLIGVAVFFGVQRQKIKSLEDWRKDHMDTAHGWVDGKLAELVQADKELVATDNSQWEKLSEHGESLAFLKAKVLNGGARTP